MIARVRQSLPNRRTPCARAREVEEILTEALGLWSDPEDLSQKFQALEFCATEFACAD